MTVSYSRLVANGSSFGCFWSILRKWKGSVYKLVWRELLAYMMLYFAINMAYRYAMTEPQQKIFEKFRNYFKCRSQNIPMSFVLGFYVTLVVKRWWEQYRLLPWPDTLALFVSAAIPGADERGRLMRRTIVRYAVLAYVITLKHVSVRVKKRFPSLQHIVDAGLMMESEKKIVQMMDDRSPMAKYWMPLVWATNIINRARKDSLISSDHIVQTLLVELSEIRRRLGSVISYDTVCVPLVYTQVVTLSVYTYFLAALIGAQMIPPKSDEEILSENTNGGDVDLYFPIITVLEFCFYIGWLKVAEVLIGPFGEDDDDIELNWLIDRHIKAAYMIVDEMHEEHPELLKDQYWDEVVPKDLPYTVASEHYRKEEPKGSAEFYKVKESDAVYANVSTTRRKSVAADDVYADYESVDTPVAERKKNWFQRQLNRMGSMRSSSTTYSSGGLFTRHRLNSVYSSPENGLVVPNVSHTNGGSPTVQAAAAANSATMHKMSLYDRLIGRRSNRGNKSRHYGSNKVNGSVPSSLKNRPRIPTPDVSKESAGMDESKNHLTVPNSTHGIITYGNNIQQSINGSHLYPSEMPVVQVLLSPIQEFEGMPSNNNNNNNIRNNNLSDSRNNGHHHHHRQLSNNQGNVNGAAAATISSSVASALAQAVLSPTLKTVGLNNVSITTATPVISTAVTMAGSPVTLTTVSMSQPFFSHLSIGTSKSSSSSQLAAILTDVTNNIIPSIERKETSLSGSSRSSVASGSIADDHRSIPPSNAVVSSTTVPAASSSPSTATTNTKRGEVYV